MSVDFSFESVSGRKSDAIPLRIAILADFGGPSTSENGDPCQPHAIDFDSFDDVFARLGVALTLPPSEVGPSEMNLRFAKFEDFHPDQLLTQVQPLRSLIELRSQLLDPETTEAAAKELLRRLNVDALTPEPPPPKSDESAEETLSRLLGKPAPGPGTPTSSTELVQRMIREIVGSNPHNAHPQQSQLADLAEAEIAAGLKAILHQPAFQALEATWRGVDFLIRNVTEEAKLYVFNISNDELGTMLYVDDLAKSPIYKQLEKIRPAVILGGYTFGALDSFILLQLGRLAKLSETVFVAGGSPELVGCSSFGWQPDPDDWTEASNGEMEEFEVLRRKPEAARLGLVMPRFLLRQPYGKTSDPIETFPFEEISGQPEHEFYLWGNSAFVYGSLLSEAFAAQVSATETSSDEIGGLPIHKFASEGVSAVKPCAEAWLSERAANVILSHGIMPLLSIQGRDAVRLWKMRSISNPPEPLPVYLQSEE